MADFNRNSRFSRGGNSGGFKKRDFNDRSSRGPVEMHKAICDKCGNQCEVPFRPTSGKPVFCNNCFEKNGSSQDRRSQPQDWSPRRSYSEDKQMFEAVCDNCSKNCKLPFRPTNNRPVYCSDCFEKGNNEPRNNENKDNSRSRNSEQPQFQASLLSDNKEQFQELNTKLDRILELLSPSIVSSEIPAEIIIEETPIVAKKRKSSKKAVLPIQG